jgi:hypothetical protein
VSRTAITRFDRWSMSVTAMLQQRHSRSCSRPSPAGVSFAGIAAYGVISNTDPNVVLVSPSVVP